MLTMVQNVEGKRMADERREHLVRFYALLTKLEKRIGGARTLAACSGWMGWPKRGVYFFRESVDYLRLGERP
jgi:hypothetical protein